MKPQSDDPVLDNLARLPRHEPASQARQRIRLRAQLALTAPGTPKTIGSRRIGAFANGALALLSAGYFIGAMAQAVRLFSAGR